MKEFKNPPSILQDRTSLMMCTRTGSRCRCPAELCTDVAAIVTGRVSITTLTVAQATAFITAVAKVIVAIATAAKVSVCIAAITVVTSTL